MPALYAHPGLHLPPIYFTLELALGSLEQSLQSANVKPHSVEKAGQVCAECGALRQLRQCQGKGQDVSNARGGEWRGRKGVGTIGCYRDNFCLRLLIFLRNCSLNLACTCLLQQFFSLSSNQFPAHNASPPPNSLFCTPWPSALAS